MVKPVVWSGKLVPDQESCSKVKDKFKVAPTTSLSSRPVKLILIAELSMVVVLLNAEYPELAVVVGKTSSPTCDELSDVT